MNDPQPTIGKRNRPVDWQLPEHEPVQRSVADLGNGLVLVGGWQVQDCGTPPRYLTRNTGPNRLARRTETAGKRERRYRSVFDLVFLATGQPEDADERRTWRNARKRRRSAR